MKPFNQHKDALFISMKGATKAMSKFISETVQGTIVPVRDRGEMLGYSVRLHNTIKREARFLTEDQLLP